MPSVSFDPVAHIYDVTRGYPESAAQRIARAIDGVAQAKIQTAFLELGVGTGRIALPLTSLGRTYTGVDISEGMLTQLETKLRQAGWREHGCDLLPWGSLLDEDTACVPAVSRFTCATPPSSLRLVRGNIERLPFRNASFDVVIAVHIFHLVDDWRQAAGEALRVLRPGGWLLHCWDEYQPGKSDSRLINERWREIVRELQGEVAHTGPTILVALKEWLQEHGLRPETKKAVTWEQAVIPRAIVESIAQRHWSSSWQIADDIFNEAVVRLRAWASDYYGDEIDRERMQERVFVIGKTQVGAFH